VAVTLQGDRFQVLLNGNVVLEATDGKYAKGGIGVTCAPGAHLRVDALGFFEEEVKAGLLKPRPAILTGPTLGGLKPGGFTVTWETSIPTPSSVEIIKGSESRFVEGEPGDRLFHEVVVPELEADTAYRYRVISGPIQSPVHGVQTPPVDASRFRFCVYGDSRSAPDPHRFVIRAMRMQTPEFVLHVGDLVSNGSRYEDWAPEFFEPADWLLHSLPFYVCIGNHEKKGPWFDAFLPLPGNKRYYDFTHGSGYFVALDSNQSLKEGSEQLSWLKEALASSEARAAAWRICFFHHPPFSESKKDYKPPKGLVETVVPLLQQSGVDLLFTGHNHNYERGKIGNLGLVVTGGGGAPLCFEEDYRVRDLPEILITRSVHHACLVEVDGKTLTFSAFTPDGKVFDAFTLRK
jgi:predicted phosphodiesterase